jgi:hypothetical protein
MAPLSFSDINDDADADEDNDDEVDNDDNDDDELLFIFCCSTLFKTIRAYFLIASFTRSLLSLTSFSKINLPFSRLNKGQ